MSQTCVGLVLCTFLALALPIVAEAETPSFDSNKFNECIEEGKQWSECVAAASSKTNTTTTPEKPFLPKNFLDLLESNASVGARIWSPSAVERFQVYINRRSSSPNS